jgi:hypothetical protein
MDAGQLSILPGGVRARIRDILSVEETQFVANPLPFSFDSGVQPNIALIVFGLFLNGDCVRRCDLIAN